MDEKITIAEVVELDENEDEEIPETVEGVERRLRKKYPALMKSIDESLVALALRADTRRTDYYLYKTEIEVELPKGMSKIDGSFLLYYVNSMQTFDRIDRLFVNTEGNHKYFRAEIFPMCKTFIKLTYEGRYIENWRWWYHCCC